MTLNEAKHTALKAITGETGTINELETLWLNGLGFTTGTLNERYMKMFAGAGYAGSFNARWIQFLAASGFTTGSTNERLLAYWLSSGGTPPVNPYGNDMVLEFVTTTPGETVTIPGYQWVGSATYDSEIDWGDGSAPSEILAWDSPNLTHEYATPGNHLVRVSGSFPGLDFIDSGDKLKLTKVYQFGDVGLIKASFHRCKNLIDADAAGAGAVNVVVITGNSSNSFYECENMVVPPDFTGWDMTAATSAYYFMVRCGAMNVTPDVGHWTLPNVTSADYMFGFCSSMPTPPDVSNFGMGQCALMTSMFREYAGVGSPRVSTFDVSSLTKATGMFLDSGLSTAEYDATLIAWAAQPVNSGVDAHFGNSKFTPGGAAEAARTKLVSVNGWIITDGGPL